MSDKDWRLVYDHFEPERQGVRETLLTLGNGYFCTRGAFEWAQADDTHYPGTYLAGGYNRLTTEIAGRTIENEDLVNLPNWLVLTFRIGDGDWFNLMAGEILDFRQELDIRRGLLVTTIRVRDKKQRETTVVSRRLVHMAQPHRAAIEFTIRAENWSERVEVLSGLDGRVINAGVKRYRALANSHLVVHAAEPFTTPHSGEEMILLVAETNHSHLRIAEAARTRIAVDGAPLEVTPHVVREEGFVAHCFSLELRQGQAATVEKMVALHTSRDVAIASPDLAARESVETAPDFRTLLISHEREWRRLWDRCDIGLVNAGNNAQLILRLHIMHLLQTLSPNTIDIDAGVPARGWHGEAYRGHIFWDELFILPFIDFRLPQLARAMLRYRYNRLEKAKQAARDAGYDGAMFPWQSGSDGREETQQMHLNPRSGRWLPDYSWQQRHVGLAIALNVWRYFLISGEKQFLAIRGAEMLIEIARFFASLAEFNPERGRYEIHQVMGPDEYHDAYPDAETPGLSNNAYTNVLVAWLMDTVERALDLLDDTHRRELTEGLGIRDEERQRWRDIARRMFVPFHDDGIISQFEGYERLEEFDWEGYRRKYGDIQRLDRILEAEGDTPNRYKLSKQADVLMLFYVFSRQRLTEIFERLGYTFTDEMWHRNIDYYLARTSHGSTLSYIVHSWVLARSHPERAWELFTQALASDIEDIQGGTTAEGIHLGAMAGTVDLVQRCLTGLDLRDGMLHFDPVLTERVQRMEFRLRYLGHWLDVVITADSISINVHPSWTVEVPVCIRGQQYMLAPGRRHSFPLKPAGQGAGCP